MYNVMFKVYTSLPFLSNQLLKENQQIDASMPDV